MATTPLVFTATGLVLLLAGAVTPAPSLKGRSNDASTGVLNFMTIGDFGGQNDSPYYTAGEASVAIQMGNTAEQMGSQFAIALGDNFYDYGVKDVSDPRFHETFEDVFTATSLQTPWYLVCGNHDHYGNASAQVAYTALSKRWKMPDLYYTKVVSIPGTNSTVQFIMIDTILLAGLTDLYDKYLPPKGPASKTQADQQWAWINETLQNSKAEWLIVGGHYPVWSVSHHGPTDVLVEKLRPLLIHYNVSAYFSGHDHNLQYIQENDIPVGYFVVGAGCHTDSSEKHKDDVPNGSLKFFHGHDDKDEKKGGYASVSVTPSYMNVTFYSHKGNVQYAVTRPKLR